MTNQEQEQAKVYLVQWNLLGEWWHVDDGTSDKEVRQTICDETIIRVTPEQVGQRLFGGFPCGNGDGYHLYHAVGYYTYTGVNGDLSQATRSEIWQRLLTGNQNQLDKLNPSGPFTEGMPDLKTFKPTPKEEEDL